MAEYTIELRDVVRAHPLFDFHYPFYDESKRQEFEQAFIRHFYFREICCPTVERFKVYLEDKFCTVFPYYNELMRTATIEYDIENPYNLTETYTRKRNSLNKGNGVVSSVGQLFDKTSSETDETRNGENQVVTDDNGKNTTTTTGSGTNTQTTQGNGSIEKNTTDQNTVNDDSKKKFLDTPQGLTDVSDSGYITNLESNERDSTETRTGTESTATTDKTTVNGSSENEQTVNGTTENKQTVKGNDSVTGNTVVSAEGEQRSTQDSNTRTENVGNEVEEYTLTRKGNIGVNPASFEIDKHIDTQKTLKRIYEMFFDECEDLFMLVY